MIVAVENTLCSSLKPLPAYSIHDNENYIITAHSVQPGLAYGRLKHPSDAFYISDGCLYLSASVKSAIEFYAGIQLATTAVTHSINYTEACYRLLTPNYEADKGSFCSGRFALKKRQFDSIPLNQRYFFRLSSLPHVLCHQSIVLVLKNMLKGLSYTSVRDYFTNN